MIFHIDLPELPADLKAKLIEQGITAIQNSALVANWAKRRPYPFPQAVLDKYNVIERVGIPVENTDQLHDLYGSKISYSADFALFIMRNTHPTRSAVAIPSKDYARSIGINCNLYSGGDIQVDFFKDGEGGMEKKHYDLSTPVTSSYKVPEGSWFCFDSTTINRVADINNICIMLCIDIEDETLSYEDFVTKCSKIVGSPYMSM